MFESFRLSSSSIIYFSRNPGNAVYSIVHEIEDATAISMLKPYSTTNNANTIAQLDVFANTSLKANKAMAYLTAIDTN